MTEGLTSPFWFSREETRGEFEVVVFDHGPDCVCGSELTLPRDHWQEIGSPQELMVMAFPVQEEPMQHAFGGPMGLL